MRKVWAIAVSEFFYVRRDRVALLMLVAVPILFTTVLGVVVGGAGNTPLRIGVVEGAPEITHALVESLHREADISYSIVSHEELEERLRRSELDAGVLLPENAERAQSMEILTDPSTQRGYEAFARMSGLQAVVFGRRSAQALMEIVLPGDTSATSEIDDRYSGTAIIETNIERTWKRVAEGVLQVSPGMLVMFILMFAAYSGEGIVQERINGTLRRLLATPISGWQYLLGRMLGKTTMGLLQFLLLAGYGMFVFKVDWGSAPVLMLLTGLIFTASSAAFGLFLGAVCRTPDQLSAIATISTLAMAALGGTWWPIEATPNLMQAAGRLLPTGQAMQAFHALILHGPEGVPDAQAAWIGMATWGLLFLIFGAVLFRSDWRSWRRSSRRAMSS